MNSGRGESKPMTKASHKREMSKGSVGRKSLGDAFLASVNKKETEKEGGLK